MIRKLIIIVFACGALWAQSDRVKEIVTPSVISDNMVLQQNTNAPIWGWTSPGETVVVTASWLQQTLSTQADANGKWSVSLKTNKAGAKRYTITIKTSQAKKTIRNILFGEVWLASGQSNMQMPLKGWGSQNVENSEAAIANSNFPQIRLFQVRQNASPHPLNDCTGAWLLSAPESATNFSAAAYFFAQKLYDELQIPIGIIHSSWGGTKAQAWLAKENLEALGDFKNDIRTLKEKYQKFEKEMAAFETAMNKWGEFETYDPTLNYSTYVKMYKRVLKKWEKRNSAKENACKESDDYPKPVLPEKFPQFLVSTLYNAMINPLIPFAVKGVIWYQGESNTIKPRQYAALFPALISSWREKWGRGDFPFYYVQIAPYRYLTDDEGEKYPALIKETQRRVMSSLANVGMVVATDITDTSRIHPPNKKDVGERLALWALAKNYERHKMICSGPIYKSMQIESGKIRLLFDFSANGLMAKGGELTHFEIAGADGKFKKANAYIDKNTVVVSRVDISAPKAVRFGWDDTAQPNLYNKAGLPASPFTTERDLYEYE
jgi:sialate O-acetylesterase